MIFRDARQAAFHWEQRSFDIAEFDTATRGERLWVADAGNGQVLAFASLWWEAELRYLHHLFVAPSWQGRGIGRRLLDHVLAAVGRPMELKTDQANAAARRFYEAAGFREVESGASNGVPWLRLRLD